MTGVFLTLLLSAIVALALIAKKLRVPYPIVFVVGAEEVGLPRMLLTIVSGESLVNDATGLVIYRFAVIAVATGAFSLLAASLSFVYVVVAGVAAGLAIGWLITRGAVAIRAGLSDELIAVSISLVTPFALYVPAEAIHASGVLAAMSGGIYMSRKSTQIFDADARLAAAYVWNLLFFVFNGAASVRSWAKGSRCRG